MATTLTTDELLEQAARDGSLDLAEWPTLLENILQRLHDIVHNDFPLPQIPQASSPPTIAAQAASVDAAVVTASPPTTQSSEPPALQSQPDDVSESLEPLSQSSTTTNKENAPPPRPPVPSFSLARDSPSVISAPPSSLVPESSSPLPPDLLSSYQSSTNMLRNTFANSPPYTIQRLAELILNPRRHYRFLPPFLSALDRAVSVTSPVSDFPLPQFHVTGSVGFLTNGDSANGVSERGGLGSDEALGGALLTPIPWIKKTEEETLAAATSADAGGVEQQLRTEDEATIDGPHGAGRVETVSVTTNGLSSTTQQTPTVTTTVTGDGDGAENTHLHQQELRSQGAVTQGELLRQEQTAGVVPVGQDVPRIPMLEAGGAAAVGRAAASVSALAEGRGDTLDVEDGEKIADDRPHARGPDLIGMEDTGPQPSSTEGRVLDMEAAAGRKSPPAASLSEAQSIANLTDMKEGDPILVDGNPGGVADTAAAAASTIAGEKRKRDADALAEVEAQGRAGARVQDEDKEMTDAGS